MQESRRLHNHLAQQAEERARLQQLNRRQNSIAEIQVNNSLKNLISNNRFLFFFQAY